MVANHIFLYRTIPYHNLNQAILYGWQVVLGWINLRALPQPLPHFGVAARTHAPGRVSGPGLNFPKPGLRSIYLLGTIAATIVTITTTTTTIIIIIITIIIKVMTMTPAVINSISPKLMVRWSSRIMGNDGRSFQNSGSFFVGRALL